MPYLPAVAAQTIPATQAEAKRRALRLYRQWLRAVPDIIDFHWLDISEAQFRQRIRLEFERNRHLDSLPVIHRALFKGQKDLEEMLNHWQQKTHIMRYFDNDQVFRAQKEESKTFLQKFYEGN